jgi:hypothetical protein
MVPYDFIAGYHHRFVVYDWNQRSGVGNGGTKKNH